VVPRFVVFHRPPNALATYQVFGAFGSMAMSWTRPVASAGPILRNSRPLSTSAVSRSPEGACVARVVIVPEIVRIAIPTNSMRFDVTNSLHERPTGVQILVGFGLRINCDEKICRRGAIRCRSDSSVVHAPDAAARDGAEGCAVRAGVRHAGRHGAHSRSRGRPRRAS